MGWFWYWLKPHLQLYQPRRTSAYNCSGHSALLDHAYNTLASCKLMSPISTAVDCIRLNPPRERDGRHRS
eukprot:5555251-Amphidinium_carterae.2